MDDFVKDILRKWKLEAFLKNFENEEIDQESFELLDNATIELLIPKAGPRLKFKKYFKSYLASGCLDQVSNVSFVSNSSGSLSSLKIVTSIPIVANKVCATPTVAVPDNVAECDPPPSTVCNIGDIRSCAIKLENDTVAECISPSTTNVSVPPPSIECPTCSSKDEFSKSIDVKGIVQKKLPDIYEKLIEGDPSQISKSEKYRINRRLVDCYIQQYGCQPTTKDKVQFAKYIVKTFPALKGMNGEGYEQWFSPALNGSKPAGFLAERFKNFRMRMSPSEKEEFGIKRIGPRSLKKLRSIMS